MEKNTVSAITALSIFSAIILTFTGALSISINLVDVLAQNTLTDIFLLLSTLGFVFVNAIFGLLFMVSKLTTEKSMALTCVHECTNTKGRIKCDNGSYCRKENKKKPTLWCRFYNKYTYIFAVNSILIIIFICAFVYKIVN